MSAPRRNFLLRMIAEFTRANAAARRYEDLRYRSARAGGTVTDIPRRVFEEFYSVAEPAESVNPGWRQSEAPAPPGRAAKALP